MYKIYINQTKILLIPSEKLDSSIQTDDENHVVLYGGKSRYFLQYIDMCEKTDRLQSITFHSPKYKKMLGDFLDLFKVVEAGGGIVINEKNEILFIHRRGSWDLPKGKLDSGETRRDAAVREVMEETGIHGVQIGTKLGVTHHAFRNGKEKRCIKKSHWYLMFAPKQPLIPQKEEDIELAEWMTLEQFYSEPRDVYPNISLILQEVKTNKK